ncbi:MAG TPA: hypothetical protein VK302_15110 [Terriglobales bacterium]|nr:hypothetical protein [Terriglobales bacterium]
MAANPLPRPGKAMATFSVNAATVTSIGPVKPGDTIEWTNKTSSPIAIAVSAVNGYFPLTVNSFIIAAGETYTSTVAPNVPPGDYPFARNGKAGGKIIVGS